MNAMSKTEAAPQVKKQKAPRRLSGRVKGSGTFSLVSRSILGMPMFDPAAREKRGMNRLIETTLKVSPNQEHRIKLICAIRLGADDLDCLLALICLAGKQGLIINVRSDFDTQRVDIVDGLETRNVRPDPNGGDDIVEAATDDNLFIGADHIRVHMTLYALCKEMGLEHGGKAYSLVQERLERLRNVSYTDYGPVGGNSKKSLSGARQTLLYFRYDEANNDELVVVLNSRLSAAILGHSFARVPLDEYRQLDTDTGRILFVRLCAAIRNPGSLRIGLDNLVDWVFFEAAKGENTKYTRRARIREALELISQQDGWETTWEHGGKQVYIQRHPKGSASEDKKTPIQGALALE